MPRPPLADRPVAVKVYLPESIHAKLALLLYSPAEQRVPYKAWTEFFTTLARQALDRHEATTRQQGATNGTQP